MLSRRDLIFSGALASSVRPEGVLKAQSSIDVGILVWERIYDWHLGNNLPLKTSRALDGRMEMEVMLTALVLRADIADTQIGVPYER